MDAITRDVTMLALERGLDGAMSRQSVAASNLANVETPGYQPHRVEFQETLRAALRRSGDDPRAAASALATVHPTVSAAPSASGRRDGNGVDAEVEMAELAESGLQYQALTRLTAHRLQMLRSVATEGGRA